MKWISILIWLLFWGAMLYSQSVPPSYEAFKAGFNPVDQFSGRPAPGDTGVEIK